MQAVRIVRIVVAASAVEEDVDFLPRIEEDPLQPLIPHLPVQGFDSHHQVRSDFSWTPIQRLPIRR